MEIGKYKTLSTNVLYLQRKDLSNVSIQKELKEIESNDCIIIDNQSFKDKKHKNHTALSSYFWDLKENHNHFPKLTWSIVRFASGYSNISKRCLLCLHEKLLILNYHNPAELLNKRSELMAKCSHENKFLLSNYKGNDSLYICNSYSEVSSQRNIMLIFIYLMMEKS